MQQMVEAIAQHQAWSQSAGVEQVWRPVGDALAVDEQVVVELLVAGQGAAEVNVQQVNEGVLAYRDDLATDLGLACWANEYGLQRLGGDQPDGQALRFQAAQHGAGEYEGQGWGHQRIQEMLKPGAERLPNENGRKMLNISRPSRKLEMYQAFSASNFSSFS
jgi:hypothetical protein